MNIQIVVAAHKKAKVPQEPIYYPMQVGAFGKDDIGFHRDDSGINISWKNPYYCELTGMYWAWKNLDCDVIGLVHYRRYFGKKNRNDFFAGVLNQKDVERLLSRYDVILPKPQNYYIESLRSHFRNHLKVFTQTDYIGLLEKTISDICPEYIEDYKKCFKRKKGHMCNMFIMRKSEFDNYCLWLFGILEMMEKEHSNFTDQEPMLRIYGFIGELLLDVYIRHNALNYYEQNVIKLNTQSFVLKLFNFCKRKFWGIR